MDSLRGRRPMQRSSPEVQEVGVLCTDGVWEIRPSSFWQLSPVAPDLVEVHSREVWGLSGCSLDDDHTNALYCYE